MTRYIALRFLGVLALGLLATSALAEDAMKPSSSTETYEAWNLACTATQEQAAPAPDKKDDAAKAANADAPKKDANGASGKKDAAADPTKKDAAAAQPHPPTNQLCEVSQLYSNKKTSNEVARISFFYDPQKKDQIIAVLRVLVDASFEKPVQILDGETELLKGTFRRCIGNFCYALFEDANGNLDKISAAANLNLQFPIGSGQELRIPMSPKGLSAALAALKTHQ